MLFPITCRLLMWFHSCEKTLFSYTRKHKVPLYLSLLVHLGIQAVLPGYVLYVVKRLNYITSFTLSICGFSGKV